MDQVQMQLSWKLENCYKPSTPNTPQQAQAGDEDKCLDRNDIAPAPVSESPKRLSPAKISPNVNEVNMTNDRPDGAVEHRARTPTVVESESLHKSRLTAKPVSVSSVCNIIDNSFCILYYNARSVLPKLDHLNLVISLYHPHIICIVESWLCKDIFDSEFFLDGYQLFRFD